MRRLLLAGLVLVSLPGCSSAQDAGAAGAALHGGDYEAAREAFTDLVRDGATEHAWSLARAYAAEGLYDAGLGALDALLRQRPADAPLLHARGWLLVETGDFAGASEAFDAAAKADDAYWPNVYAMAHLLETRGQRRPAYNLYYRLWQAHETQPFRDADRVMLAAESAARLAPVADDPRIPAFDEANDAFRLGHRLDPGHADLLVRWGDLFREKYNNADAERTYNDALAANPRHAGALVGLARLGGGFEQKEELAKQALAINPNHVGALSVLAGLSIVDALYAEAEAYIERALATNPNAVEPLAHQAAIHHLQGDADAFARAEQRALDAQPGSAAFYLTVAEDLTYRFRYPDAVEMTRRAVQADGANPNAQAALGAALLRLGRRDEARRHLDRAFQQDAYNLFAANALTLIETTDAFATLESDHFRVLLSPGEADVFGPQILAVAEAAYDALAPRYGYEPEGKIRIEAYDDPADFGVRITGVPHRGLLGVAFGDVVVINTPRAQPGGDYNWARTLWHELAHTMAIGATGFRVPRWLTEGLSVYEEGRARPEWAREMDDAFFSAFDTGQLLPISEIDRGFTRPQFPGQILLSYYHASKIIGFLEATYGWDAVRAVLQNLSEGQPIAASLEVATGQDVDALERQFRSAMTEQRARLAGALGERSPFVQRLVEARAALDGGDLDAAERLYTEALDLYPAEAPVQHAGLIAAHHGLAEVYRARGDDGALRESLTRLVAQDEHAAEEARELARLWEASGEPARAADLLARSLDVDPHDLETRQHLGGLYLTLGRPAAAADEFRAALALDPVDRADAYFQLATALHATGNGRAAKRAVLQSLETAPNFRDAQKLLLEIVGEGS